jgi:cyanophycinase
MDAAMNSENPVSHSEAGLCPVARWFASTALVAVAFFAQTGLADDELPDKAADVVHGKLVICGGGALPAQLRNRFIELAGGPAAKIVVITTASVYADTDKMPSKLAFWREQTFASLSVLHTRSRQTANEPGFAQPLRDATGVWFVGGNQNWLTDTYLGTRTEQELRGVLSRSGVVGGTSAGAAIMSPVMIRRDRPELETGPGFGFLPGTVVDQHFLKRNRQGRLLKVLDSHPNLMGLGIDEGTGVVVEGNHISVVGDSQVIVCCSSTSDRTDAVQTLAPGAEANLDELRTLVAQVIAKPAAITAPVSSPAATSVVREPMPEATDEPAAPTREANRPAQ